MIKSDEEIEIIKNGAKIADLVVKLIKPGQTELEIAIAGRDRMEREIAKIIPWSRIHGHLGMVSVWN